jgi:hypothetical protein
MGEYLRNPAKKPRLADNIIAIYGDRFVRTRFVSHRSS